MLQTHTYSYMPYALSMSHIRMSFSTCFSRLTILPVATIQLAHGHRAAHMLVLHCNV